jgi:hypothetical protein
MYGVKGDDLRLEEIIPLSVHSICACGPTLLCLEYYKIPLKIKLTKSACGANLVFAPAAQ